LPRLGVGAVWMPARIAWFGWFLERVVVEPEVLRSLQESMGLNTLIPESHLYHTSGFRASPELLALSPLEDWRSRKEMSVYLRYHSGSPVFPVLPGVLGGVPDDALLKLLAEAHRLGMDVWGHLGLWCYGGELFPEYAMRDIEGNPPKEQYFHIGAGFCPSKARLNNWIKACLVEVTRRYEIDGLQLDHARYPHPANLQSLFGCGCPDCVSEAAKLGYDFPRMKRALLGFKQYLKQLDEGKVKTMAKAQLSLTDLLGATGRLEELTAWLTFRAELIASKMNEFAEAVHGAAKQGFVLGTDVFPPSIALLGGHVYPRWERSVDFTMGGFGDLVGWGEAVLTLFREAAALLCKNVKGLGEADALRFVYALLGYGDLGLPLSTEALRPPHATTSLGRVFERELLKAKMLTTGRVPFYVSLPALPPQALQRTLVLGKQLGFGGVVLASVDEARTQRVVKETFG